MPSVQQRLKTLLGLELECYHPVSSAYLAGITRYVCRDGSLPTGGAEIKSVGASNRMVTVGADIAQRAHLAGGKVNDKCGFHVHLSLPRGFTAHRSYWYHNEQMLSVFDSMNRVQSYLEKIEESTFAMMPPSRRDNTYCRRISGSSSGSMHNHYSWASWSSSVPTLEIRIHGGTLNGFKVAGWLDAMKNLQSIISDLIVGKTRSSDYSEKLVDDMPTGSIAKRYLTARESSPVLEKFGF